MDLPELDLGVEACGEEEVRSLGDEPNCRDALGVPRPNASVSVSVRSQLTTAGPYHVWMHFLGMKHFSGVSNLSSDGGSM